MSRKSRTKLITITSWLSAWLPPFIWAGVIFLFSSQSILPGFETNTYDFIFKKLAHITVYGILYFLVFRAVDISLKPKKKTSPTYWLVPFAVILLYAISDEIHQSFIPGRHATMRDVGYDLLGGLSVFLRIHGYI